jgi:acetyltransferase
VSKAVLDAYGITITRERLARTADEAAEIAEAIGGSVALKIASPDIPHKTESGAIRLDVSGGARARVAYEEVLAAARRYRPNARIDGVLVQEMVRGGVELMLGLTRDPVFGPVVTVAMGGIHVEVLRDAVHRIPPVSQVEAREMLDELRMRKMLEGVRGAPRSDVRAVADAIGRLSWLAHDFGDEIRELDVNPFVVLPDGVCALDALVVKSERDGSVVD